MRDAICRLKPLARAECITSPTWPIEIATRITDTVIRICVAFAAAHPEAALRPSLARSLQLSGS